MILTTEELLDLLNARDAGSDHLVKFVEELVQAHREEAWVMADLAAGR